MLETTSFDYVAMRHLAVSLALALLATFIVTPFLMVRYRQRVSALMATRSDDTDPRTNSVAKASANAKAIGREAKNLRKYAEGVTNARSWAYAVGGFCQAFLLSLIFAIQYSTLFSLPLVVVGLAVFLLPTLFTFTQIRIISGWRKLLLSSVLLVGLLLSGIAVRLVFIVFILHIFLPAVVLLIFNLRFWRGAAPQVFLLSIAGSSGWMFSVTLYQGLFGAGGGISLALLFRLIGLVVGLLLGLMLLRQMARLHAQGQLSDQELVLDTWWLIYTIFQAFIFAIKSDELMIGLLVLSSFGLYWWVKRKCLARIPRTELIPRRLLLLGVFGNSHRSESLFEQLRQAWNPIGSIEMIAGRDLALIQVGPLDFLAFLTGRLSDRFAGSVSVVAKRMNQPQHLLADGGYPAYQSLCLSNTWHRVMRTLTRHSDAVVMDLREFNKKRQGCLTELKTLSQEFANHPVVLITDASTDLPWLHSTLAKLGISCQGDDNSWWQLVKANNDEGRTIRFVVAAIIHRQDNMLCDQTH